MKCDAHLLLIGVGRDAFPSRRTGFRVAITIALCALVPIARQLSVAQSGTATNVRKDSAFVADASEYSKWTTVNDASTSYLSGARPVLLSLVPVSGIQGKPYGIKLDSPKGGATNRWELRYVRDFKTTVAIFAIAQMCPSHAHNIEVPLGLTALDTPPPGTHTYVLEVRYVGSQPEGDHPKLEIRNARLTANSL